MTNSNGIMNTLGNPTIHPNPNFNANNTALILHKAMIGSGRLGIGCDKEKIIQALCTINNEQRQAAAHEFKSVYGKDLVSELKKELSGDFENLLVALMERPDSYDAQQLHKAIAGIGTKESVLLEIMITRTNKQIAMIKSAYKELYGKVLEKDIVGDTSGAFQRLLVSLGNEARDESGHIDPVMANKDARQLYRDGVKHFGVDSSTFNRVLATQNFNQLQAVFDEYGAITGHSIEKAIESEFTGDNRDAYLAVVKCVRNRNAFFAELLHKTMEGLGTRNKDLIRIVVSRSEVDLADIRIEYQKLYKISLEGSITDDCSGAYKDALIKLVQGNLPRENFIKGKQGHFSI